MERNNWFDAKYQDKLAKADADDALKQIASDPRIRAELQEALDAHDAQPAGYIGASRSQVVRNTVARLLDLEAV